MPWKENGHFSSYQAELDIFVVTFGFWQWGCVFLCHLWKPVLKFQIWLAASGLLTSLGGLGFSSRLTGLFDAAAMFSSS